MKKSKFSVVFVVRIGITLVLVVFIILSIIFFTECQLPLRGNLFDKSVLNKYELGWLEKPEYARSESQSIEGRYYTYRCEIENIDEFESYVEKVFNNFKVKKYTVAHYVKPVDAMLNGSYCVVTASDELDDYYEDYDGGVNYVFYYSTKSLNEMEQINTAKKFGDRHLEIRLLNGTNGKSEIKIRLFAGKLKNSNIIYDG